MKNYFKFNLTGNQVFRVWMIFMVLFIIPYIFVQFKIQELSIENGNPHQAMAKLGILSKWYGVTLLLFLVEYTILFFFAKQAIGGIEYKGTSLSFVGKFSEYISLLISGILLSLITIGIYSPWFITKMYRFFARNTFYNSDNLEFKGKGSDLFLIILFTVIIPMMALFTVIMIFALIIGLNGTANYTTDVTKATVYSAIMLIGIFALITPYIYYSTKWKVNFKFKNFIIQWETDFWSSAAKIFVEILISLITLGIYLPIAFLKLYAFFGQQTIARSATNAKKCGYDIELGKDFISIWKELLLSILTLGIYYPWAVCNIAKTVLGKTYIEEME